jgi:hypothetical protein
MDKELQEKMVSETIKDLPKGLLFLLWGLLFVGILVFLFGALKIDELRAWQTFLINFLFWSGISLSGVIFAAILQMTNARWGRPIKRISEGMGSFLPVSFILFLLIFLGREVIFPWAVHPIPGKEKWLSIPFLFLRDGIGLIILYGLSITFLYFSLKPDLIFVKGMGRAHEKGILSRMMKRWKGVKEEGEKSQKILTILTPIILIAYAVIFTLIAFDLVMSLDPHWYSTLFGGYFFMGNLYIGLASITIISILVRKYLGLEEYIDIPLLHDLGKLIFAFCLISLDFFWSQFLVIWYGNLPEETGFVILRGMEMPWAPLSWSVLVVCFILPFLIMLSKNVKRNPKTLFALCMVIVLSMWLERYVLIVPSLWKGNTAPFGLMEIFITLGFFAGFALTFLYFLKKLPIFPVTDPLFQKRDGV